MGTSHCLIWSAGSFGQHCSWCTWQLLGSSCWAEAVCGRPGFGKPEQVGHLLPLSTPSQARRRVMMFAMSCLTAFAYIDCSPYSKALAGSTGGLAWLVNGCWVVVLGGGCACCASGICDRPATSLYASAAPAAALLYANTGCQASMGS